MKKALSLLFIVLFLVPCHSHAATFDSMKNRTINYLKDEYRLLQRNVATVKKLTHREKLSEKEINELQSAGKHIAVAVGTLIVVFFGGRWVFKKLQMPELQLEELEGDEQEEPLPVSASSMGASRIPPAPGAPLPISASSLSKIPGSLVEEKPLPMSASSLGKIPPSLVQPAVKQMTTMEELQARLQIRRQQEQQAGHELATPPTPVSSRIRMTKIQTQLEEPQNIETLLKRHHMVEQARQAEAEKEEQKEEEISDEDWEMMLRQSQLDQIAKDKKALEDKQKKEAEEKRKEAEKKEARQKSQKEETGKTEPTLVGSAIDWFKAKLKGRRQTMGESLEKSEPLSGSENGD